MTTTFVQDRTASATWTDPRRRAWLLALVVPVVPLLVGWAAWSTGFEALWWIGPVLVFVVMPALDAALGVDVLNPPEEARASLEADRYYRWCTYAYLPAQYLALIAGCAVLASGKVGFWGELGLALTLGCIAGVAINTAHELGHKAPKLEKRLAKLALAQSGYGHFVIEHNRGHHARVATPEDPASSRMGESLYRFMPRTVIGGLRSAVHLERERNDRLGRRFWRPGNELLNAWALSVVLFAGLIAVFGWTVAGWLALQAVVGFALLEVVNYIEHYGLLRDRRPDGRYERCRPEHSWNAANVVSNLVLYQLQRHSDHHANPTRRYQTLRHFDSAPQLPTGYAGMILLALVPPLWRRAMDERVLRYYEGDMDRINVHPPSRARVEAWAATVVPVDG